MDQSAAEYDCADEAMDGPDSICVDDLILEQNRTRVLSMHIQKPIINKWEREVSHKKSEGGGTEKRVNERRH